MTKFQDGVYVYDFQWGGTKGSKVEFVLGASHANELGYFYYGGEWDWMGQGASITEENRNARHALSNAMATYLAQFIHTGNPNGKADLPIWETWSNEPAGLKTMNFDASSESGSSGLKLYMTKREYLVPEILKELEDSGDKVAMGRVRRVATRTSPVPDCE
jgi:para-nitrobenzyl esterase